MHVEELTDPQEFLRRAAPILADEARHNLILGIGNTLLRAPDIYPEYRLFLVSDGGSVVCAALITVPYNLIVSDAVDPAAVTALAEWIASSGIRLPGTNGNQPTVGDFVAAWEQATGGAAMLNMEQGVFALSAVQPVAGSPGRPRPGRPSDQKLLEIWMRRFVTEALPDEPYEADRMRKAIARRLSGEGPNAYWLWEHDGDVVSWCGHGNPTGRGIRIGPVYTPPEHRGRGYASALVAAQSRWLLDNGYEFCFLYTDLANPTSNAIYERIGYRQVAEAGMYSLSQPKD